MVAPLKDCIQAYQPGLRPHERLHHPEKNSITETGFAVSIAGEGNFEPITGAGPYYGQAEIGYPLSYPYSDLQPPKPAAWVLDNNSKSLRKVQ